MNYFEEYEKLKKVRDSITPGSIWEDFCGEVEITDVSIAKFEVRYVNIPSGGIGFYGLNNFIRHFHRVG
jgi:hypothetical protein